MATEAVTNVMELDFDDSASRNLWDYVYRVSSAMGLRCECACVLTERPVSVYLAVDGHLDGYPDRDAALLWDEDRGWSAAVETYSGEDLLVIADMGPEIRPEPARVAAWATGLLAGSGPGFETSRLGTRPS
ncbi:DUF6292 family protein [Kutzneria sp. NPDC051319]|uniref:DUF6292 family protein n=1 Tax=Kutzneria sp. NPDC051319 TaxID=3155047 RepID=UPI00343A5E8C